MKTYLAETAVEYFVEKGIIDASSVEGIKTEQPEVYDQYMEELEKKLRDTASSTMCCDCDERMPEEPPYDDSHD